MRRIKANICLTLLCLSFPAAAESDLLPSSLQPAWAELCKSHPALKAAQARNRSQQESVQSAKSQTLPRVDAAASYQYTTAVPILDITVPSPIPGAQGMSLSRDLGDHDRTELGLTASWLAWSAGARTQAVKAQEELLRASASDQLQLKRSLALQFGMQHLALQVAVREARLRALRLEARNEHLRTLEALAAAGTATRSQVLAARAEAARSAADSALAWLTIDSLRNEFQALAGSPYPESLLAPADDATGYGIDELPATTTMQGGLRSLAAEASEARSQAVLAGSQATAASRWPWLSLFAGYRVGDPGVNQMSTGWMHWGVAGVQANWNLFDGGTRKADISRAQLDAEALQSDAARSRLAQGTQAATLSSEEKALSAETKALLVAQEAAKEALAMLEASSQEGIHTADDLLDARIRVAELQTRLQQSRIRSAMVELRTRFNNGQPMPFEEEVQP